MKWDLQTELPVIWLSKRMTSDATLAQQLRLHLLLIARRGLSIYGLKQPLMMSQLASCLFISKTRHIMLHQCKASDYLTNNKIATIITKTKSYPNMNSSARCGPVDTPAPHRVGPGSSMSTGSLFNISGSQLLIMLNQRRTAKLTAG